jgi:hypothetical protein
LLTPAVAALEETGAARKPDDAVGACVGRERHQRASELSYVATPHTAAQLQRNKKLA